MNYESDGTPKDLWDHEEFYNSPKPKPFVPLTVESFKKDHPEKVIEKDDKPKLSSEAEKYRKAWNTIYKRLPEWRRKEIDERMKNGTMGEDKTDFARQVASLAEKL